MIATERIKARDLMRSDVACLSPSDSIRDAVRFLERFRIDGAPVVNPAGKLVGMLSLRDIARAELVGEDWIDGCLPAEPAEALTLEVDFDENYPILEDYDIRALGQATVGDWMSTRFVSVGPKTSLRLLCQVMAHDALHRLFVVEDGRLVGVVSSLDVVRLLAES